MKPIEEINTVELKKVAKLLNEAIMAANPDIKETPIKMFGKSKPDIIEEFTVAIETYSATMKLPEDAVQYFNWIYADEAETTETGEVVTTGEEATPTEEIEEPAPKPVKEKKAKKAKAQKPAKAPKAPKTAKAPKPAKEKKEPKVKKEFVRDEFGFVVGSKRSLFATAIKEKPMTMRAVMSLPWNEKKMSYYTTFKKLVEAGVAGYVGEDNLLTILKK